MIGPRTGVRGTVAATMIAAIASARAHGMAQVVWFKRDLRIHDHRALSAAAERGAVLAIYVIEPDYWAQPDSAQRHWAFIRECLEELDTALRERGARLLVRRGEITEVFTDIHARYGIDALHAHEETGNDWSYQRDCRVRAWCREQGIALHEHPNFGVIRGLTDRNAWHARWEARMREPVIDPPQRLHPAVDPDADGWTPWPSVEAYDRRPCPGRQVGGRRAGESLLAGFLTQRGRDYRRAMASPLTGEWACSRLSPHIAYGTLSMREIVQTHRRYWADAGPGWRASLKSFESRLHWHCHFIQKLEDEPTIELRNLHRGYDGMRENDFDEHLFHAWCEGQTGLPFVDACMRMLHHTGWLNFRMRAMLMAVAGYHLWLHWRAPALHLARVFTDYEPGIHYAQSQMQTGTTGINAVRIYNPVKQSYDQDPDGVFIRRFVPELAGVPAQWIHEPWRLPPAWQGSYGVTIGSDYPAPIIDHQAAAREARRRIREHRARHDMRAEADRIRQRHASRKRPRERHRSGIKSDTSQGELDL